jgi:hypothetical protein
MHKFNDKGLCLHLAKVLGEEHPLSFPTYFSSRIAMYFPLNILFPLQTNVTLPCWKTSMREGPIFPFLFGAIVIPFSN